MVKSNLERMVESYRAAAFHSREAERYRRETDAAGREAKFWAGAFWAVLVCGPVAAALVLAINEWTR